MEQVARREKREGIKKIKINADKGGGFRQIAPSNPHKDPVISYKFSFFHFVHNEKKETKRRNKKKKRRKRKSLAYIDLLSAPHTHQLPLVSGNNHILVCRHIIKTIRF
eukprot:comp97132_c0_seq1/m.48655 comp97132_c0_seq1/g.48655  ORF comp97132_c0_seq1/g.48655 comp97132_c0_seq1/m.48655 type:complete len:108 (+) comp97132_c0_seq1:215-538(+)